MTTNIVEIDALKDELPIADVYYIYYPAPDVQQFVDRVSGTIILGRGTKDGTDKLDLEYKKVEGLDFEYAIIYK